jgi:hypothetical protein
VLPNSQIILLWDRPAPFCERVEYFFAGFRNSFP